MQISGYEFKIPKIRFSLEIGGCVRFGLGPRACRPSGTEPRNEVRAERGSFLSVEHLLLLPIILLPSPAHLCSIRSFLPLHVLGLIGIHNTIIEISIPLRDYIRQKGSVEGYHIDSTSFRGSACIIRTSPLALPPSIAAWREAGALWDLLGRPILVL